MQYYNNVDNYDRYINWKYLFELYVNKYVGGCLNIEGIEIL